MSVPATAMKVVSTWLTPLVDHADSSIDRERSGELRGCDSPSRVVFLAWPLSADRPRPSTPRGGSPRCVTPTTASLPMPAQQLPGALGQARRADRPGRTGARRSGTEGRGDVGEYVPVRALCC